MDRLGLKDLIIQKKEYDQIIFILAKLQRCREEREKIIQEKASSAKIINSSKNYYS